MALMTGCMTGGEKGIKRETRGRERGKGGTKIETATEAERDISI